MNIRRIFMVSEIVRISERSVASLGRSVQGLSGDVTVWYQSRPLLLRCASEDAGPLGVEDPANQREAELGCR